MQYPPVEHAQDGNGDGDRDGDPRRSWGSYSALTQDAIGRCCGRHTSHGGAAGQRHSRRRRGRGELTATAARVSAHLDGSDTT